MWTKIFLENVYRRLCNVFARMYWYLNVFVFFCENIMHISIIVVINRSVNQTIDISILYAVMFWLAMLFIGETWVQPPITFLFQTNQIYGYLSRLKFSSLRPFFMHNTHTQCKINEDINRLWNYNDGWYIRSN